MTKSTADSGLIFCGSPPSSIIASRMAARSTTAGTPVMSCNNTRAGRKAISWFERPVAVQSATARMWSTVTERPSSQRSRFSSTTLRENGSRETSPISASAALRLK